jgi:hypothetical protein
MDDFLDPRENFGHPEKTSSSSKHQIEKKAGSGFRTRTHNKYCENCGNDKQCCGFGMFIPDPNFFHPASRIHIKELKYLTQKNVSKLSEI